MIYTPKSVTIKDCIYVFDSDDSDTNEENSFHEVMMSDILHNKIMILGVTYWQLICNITCKCDLNSSVRILLALRMKLITDDCNTSENKDIANST